MVPTESAMYSCAPLIGHDGRSATHVRPGCIALRLAQKSKQEQGESDYRPQQELVPLACTAKRKPNTTQGERLPDQQLANPLLLWVVAVVAVFRFCSAST